MVKLISYYSIFLGLCILGLWAIILSGEGMPEGPVESTFHLISEFLMAGLCILGGILSLLRKRNSIILLISSHAMVTYSVLNAAGYYGQNSSMVMSIPFVAMAIISVLILIFFINNKGQ